MPQLNCSVGTCEHNNSNCCCINSINVSGAEATRSASTCCESFQEKNMAFTNDVKIPNFNVQVSCEATNCTHNLSNQCNAQHIDVGGQLANRSEQTQCSSFNCE